jgi:hypothetical protein
VQSAFVVHPFAQMLPLGAHAPPGHDCVCAAGQDAEAPVQFAASVAVPPVHDAKRHDTVLALNLSVGHVSEVPSH